MPVTLIETSVITLVIFNLQCNYIESNTMRSSEKRNLIIAKASEARRYLRRGYFKKQIFKKQIFKKEGLGYCCNVLLSKENKKKKGTLQPNLQYLKYCQARM